MNPWIAIAAFVVWTVGVAYFASDYGQGKAQKACQEERDAAAIEQQRQETEHAAKARQLEEDRRHDQEHITGLRSQLRRLGRDKPVACRLGPERLQLWNAGNAGADVPGEPAGAVPADVRGAPDR